MFHHSFVSPLFGCSREYFPPFTILPKRGGDLLSRRNLPYSSRCPPFQQYFGITKISGYDPPWHYNVRNNPKTKFSRGVHSHYPTMSVDEICSLPVAELADENCALVLWVTFPRLKEGIRVLEAWGFRYVTVAFNWFKANKSGKPFFGIGYYTKSNSEIALLGIKGKMQPVSNFVSQVVVSNREEHSKKPDVVREKIVELFGDVPRVELFARQKTDGWSVWGNEVESDILMPEKIF